MNQELFDDAMEKDPMRLVEIGSRAAEKLVAHIVKGYERGIDHGFMAQTIYDDLKTHDDATKEILLMSCLMSMGHATYQLKIKKN